MMLPNNDDGFPAPPMKPERSILLCVVSSNPDLAVACRVHLEHLCPAGFSIEQCYEPSAAPRGCDIYVWDYESCPSLLSTMAAADTSAKLVILEKSSLSAIRERLPHHRFAFLHKPVSSSSLRVLLGSAVARLKLSPTESGSFGLNLDRDLLLQELLETNLKLHEYDEDRSNFLMRAIHDIRVPLMAIQGYCDLLLDGQVGSLHYEQAQMLGRMRRSLTRLGKIVEAVLDLGAGAQTATKPKFESASLEGCVQQAVYEILPFTEKKQITLKVELEPPADPLWLDPSQIEQVLINLLDNGCKFTPMGGSITIRGRSITPEDSGPAGSFQAIAGYRLDITDTGPGIRPEHIERIFDEHSSYGDAMNRSGSGLGLAICRMIVRAHKGQIWASSDDCGATFSLLLPAVQSFNHLQFFQLTA